MIYQQNEAETKAKQSLIYQDQANNELVLDRTNISAWFSYERESESQRTSIAIRSAPATKSIRTTRTSKPKIQVLAPRNIKMIMSEIIDKRQKQKTPVEKKTIPISLKCSYFNYPTRETVSMRKRASIDRPSTAAQDKLCVRALSKDTEKRLSHPQKYHFKETVLECQTYTFKKFPQRTRICRQSERKEERRLVIKDDKFEESLCKMLSKLNEKIRVKDSRANRSFKANRKIGPHPASLY